MSWLKEVIGTEKAIIAMLHMQPMPGDPYFDKAKGMKWVIEKAREDLDALQEGGVDAIMFSNEYSLPYLTDVKKETVAAMARVIGELQPEIRIPYGVNVIRKHPWIWQPQQMRNSSERSLPVFMPVILESGIPIVVRPSDIRELSVQKM